MIIDTSAVIAILQDEPDADRLSRAMEDHGSPALSAATLVECYVVAARKGSQELIRIIEELLALIEAEIVPVDRRQAQHARDAYLAFGRGTGHPARLNFGDCFAYALARERNEPLLFVGNDFTHTDIQSALVP